MKIAFLFTCYNRIEKTKNCVDSVMRAVEFCNKKIKGTEQKDDTTKDCEDSEDRSGLVEAEWYITDAGSVDGTVDMLNGLLVESKLHMRVENSDTFYSQGMRKSMEMLKAGYERMDSKEVPDYVCLINDDVVFYEDFLYRILMRDAVIIGATDDGDKQSYGGVRYIRPISSVNHFIPRSVRYEMVKTDDSNRRCDTFNANCVIVPYEVFAENELMDQHFVHGLGDFDYGLSLTRKGIDLISTDFFVGKCSNNSKDGTWMDTSLPRRERISRLNSKKGTPTKQWFYFLKKNFGFATAVVHSISPYVRIMLGK